MSDLLKFFATYAGFFLPRKTHLWPRSQGTALDNSINNTFKLDICHVY